MGHTKRKFTRENRREVLTTALVLGVTSFIIAWMFSRNFISFLNWFISVYVVQVAVVLVIAKTGWIQPMDVETGWRVGIKPGSNDRYVIGFAVFNILLVVLVGAIMFTNVFGTKSVVLWKGGKPHILVFVLAIPLIPAILIVGYNIYNGIRNQN